MEQGNNLISIKTTRIASACAFSTFSPWRVYPDSTASPHIEALGASQGKQHNYLSGWGIKRCGLKGRVALCQVTGGNKERVAVDQRQDLDSEATGGICIRVHIHSMVATSV